MKKIYFSILSLAVCFAMNAQVAVTLSVDMNGQTVSGDGVHVAGDFADGSPDSGYPNWNPAGIELTDPDEDGIYSVTLDLDPAVYQFKFINGNDWPFDEGNDIPQACRYPGSSNREVVVGDSFVDLLVVWKGCGPAGENVDRFRVDMSMQPAINPVGIHVAGDFQDWNPAGNKLYDYDENGVWEAYYSIGDASSVEFKYLNGDNWELPAFAIENISGDCGSAGDPQNGNRLEGITDANTTLPIYCFGQCDPCTQPAPVTFKVDMSLQTVSPNGVHIAGGFGSAGYPEWNPGGIEMTDTDGDNIYEVTLNLPNGTYKYKFVNDNAWGGDEAAPTACAAENSTDRFITISGSDPVTAQNCFAQCSETCEANPDPSAVTFSVNMSNETVSPDGVWLIGSFTSPAWQGGAILMEESDEAGIWFVTVTISGSAEIYYKFVNGIADASDESNSEFEGMGAVECAQSNGLNGHNRVHVRSGQAESLPTYCFNTCDICGEYISVEEKGVVANLSVYPNPAENVLNISFTNPVAQKVTISVFNNMGQQVLAEDLGFISGQRVMNLNTAPLASGIYTLAIANGAAVQTVRVAVK